MPDNLPNPLPETTQQVEDVTEDVTALLREFTAAAKTMSEHMARLLDEGVHLHPIEAVKQVPDAAAALATEAGEGAGDIAHAGGGAVAAVPAVASDTLETAGTVPVVVKRGVRYTLRKRRS